MSATEGIPFRKPSGNGSCPDVLQVFYNHDCRLVLSFPVYMDDTRSYTHFSKGWSAFGTKNHSRRVSSVYGIMDTDDGLDRRFVFIFFGNGMVSVLCLGAYGTIVGSITMAPLLLQADELPVFNTSRHQRKVLFATLAVGLVLVLCILPVELQIKWNKLGGVEGISSTGQLMSLTIGSFSLLRAIWLVLMTSEEKEEEGGESANTGGSTSSPK